MGETGTGLSLGTVIFMLVVGYNVFFDDDDEDKKDVESKKADKPAIEKTVDVESVKHTAKTLIEDAKVLLKETVDEYKKDKAPSEETIIASDEKEEKLEEPEKDKIYNPSLQLPESESSDQPTFRTIE